MQKRAIVTTVVVLLSALAVWFLLVHAGTPPTSQSMPSTPEDSVVLADGEYALSLQDSVIRWSGTKTLILDYVDRGIIKLVSGDVTVLDGLIMDGMFTIDMATIAAESTGRGQGETGLTRHLKSADFFDVENYPTAVFVITKSKAIGDKQFQITGNLTVKGVSNAVSFPATVYMQNGRVYAKADFEVDRTLWDVRYGSDKFFDNLANNVISDMIGLSLELAAE